MKIVYFSRNGKVKRFVEKLQKENSSLIVESTSDYSGGNYCLITPTYGHGEVPEEVENFLKMYYNGIVAVASSGNKAWGINLFARSGNIISEKYNVPLLLKFENQGFKPDIEKFLVSFFRKEEI